MQDLYGVELCDSLVQVGFNFRYSEMFQRFHSTTGKECDTGIFDVIFLSKHPAGAEWGISSPVEAWLRHNGIHAIDMVIHFMGQITSIKPILLPQENGRFLLCAMCSHDSRRCSILTLGNSTQKFIINATLTTGDGTTVSCRGLSDLQITPGAGSAYETQILTQKCMDDGWSKRGYGPELQAFIDRVVTGVGVPSPNISDALQALCTCEAILSKL
jgi:hypothetical protein